MESWILLIIKYIPINIVKGTPIVEDTKHPSEWFYDERAISAVFCKSDMNPWSEYLDDLSMTPHDRIRRFYLAWIIGISCIPYIVCRFQLNYFYSSLK